MRKIVAMILQDDLKESSLALDKLKGKCVRSYAKVLKLVLGAIRLVKSCFWSGTVYVTNCNMIQLFNASCQLVMKYCFPNTKRDRSFSQSGSTGITTMLWHGRLKGW
jgi:hypothetical protein